MENHREVRSEGAPGGVGAERGGLGPGPFADLAPGAVHMRAKEDSKIRNLPAFAVASLAQPAARAIVCSGCGRATTETVTCAEILERRPAGLHRATRLRYRSARAVRRSPPPGPAPEPREPGASLSVPKNMPSLAILLSEDALDPRRPGYQPPSPRSSPSSQPTGATSQGSLGDPAAGEGSAKRSPPGPGAAERHWPA